MEGNGKSFREGSLKMKQRRLSRAASIAVDPDGLPIAISSGR